MISATVNEEPPVVLIVDDDVDAVSYTHLTLPTKLEV